MASTAFSARVAAMFAATAAILPSLIGDVAHGVERVARVDDATTLDQEVELEVRLRSRPAPAPASETCWSTRTSGTTLNLP